jgi:hypothetical protein
VWFTVTCSYSDWSRRYKHEHRSHSHDAEGAFVVAAKNAAVAEMQGSGQARFANVTVNQVGTSSMQVKLPNDPGDGYREI